MSASLPTKSRLWEVDALRGVAIVLMVIYHFTWDLNFVGIYQGNMLAFGWQTFARSIATTFIFVMGVSMTLSYRRERSRLDTANLWPKYLRRGGKIFGLGLLISGATYFFIGPNGFVVFGILHLLGASMIAAYPFLPRSPWLSLVAGLLAIAAGIYLAQFVVAEPWLIWLGVRQVGRYMVDYYPFLPWWGISLLGIWAGYTLYPAGKRRFSLPDWSDTAPVRGLRFLGRHSLPIYMIHQPILLGVLLTYVFLSTGFLPM